MVTMYPNAYRIAVIGATGNTGSEILNIIAEKDFPTSEIYAIASKKSCGQKVPFGNRGFLTVKDIDDINFKNIDLAFFCAGSTISKKYVPIATKCGTVVIDKTSYFRHNSYVPLIVPEVNETILLKGVKLGVISNPNCIAIPLSMTLKALDNISKIKRVIVSTYQSVSGAGKWGNQILTSETKDFLEARASNPNSLFKKKIAFNVIPFIGERKIDNSSGEEEKISNEVARLVGTHVKTFVTAVRVPVFRGHSISVTVETKNNISPETAYNAFQNFPGIVVRDNSQNNDYVTPIESVHQDVLFISRIRRDATTSNSLGYWVCCDNLRKGAALNSLMIAKSLIKIDPTLQLFKAEETYVS